MAFVADRLASILYANGFTLWHYKTADLKANVQAAGYFDEVAGTLRVDDWIIVAAGDDTVIFSVAGIVDGAVTLSSFGRTLPAADGS